MALADKKHSRIYSTTGSDSDKVDSTKLNRMQAKFSNNEYLEDEDAFETLGCVLYQMQQMSEELDELRRFSNTELNHKNSSKMILNCGWYGGSNAVQYLPFGYGGTFESTSPNGYLEYGGFIAPCNGSVESVIIRSEQACGNSVVNVHRVYPDNEVANFNPGTGISDVVNMQYDDRSYKFDSFDGQYSSNMNVFNAGDVIFISFDPTNASLDSIATMVLNLDWTNSL
jgi:hypothetical protein